MKDAGAASRYAKAAIESAANDSEVTQIGEELAAFAQVFTDEPDLKKVMMHPGIEGAAKLKVLTETASELGVSEKTARALQAVFENGRINILPEISLSYADLADRKLNRIHVQVRTAYPITDSDKGALQEKFRSITGKEPVVDVEVDKSLIGGLVARVGSKVYDGSLSNQLRLMKVKLEQEA